MPKDEARSERERVIAEITRKYHADELHTEGEWLGAVWDAAIDAAAERIADAVAQRHSASKALQEIIHTEAAALKGDRNVT